MSSEEAYRRYRGFDGVVWPGLAHPAFPMDGGVTALNNWPIVNDYLQSLPNASECEAVALSWDDPPIEDLVTKGWSFAGFDVGYFLAEWSHFSVILHEVVFGPCEPLREFSRTLNANLLLHRREDAEPILRCRERLAVAGDDVEANDPPAEVIAVFIRETPRENWVSGERV